MCIRDRINPPLHAFFARARSRPDALCTVKAFETLFEVIIIYLQYGMCFCDVVDLSGTGFRSETLCIGYAIISSRSVDKLNPSTPEESLEQVGSEDGRWPKQNERSAKTFCIINKYVGRHG